MNASKSADAVRTWSLRTRLIVLLLVATCGLWGIASWSIYREAQKESQALFDESLKETAYLLLSVVEHEMAEHGAAYAAEMVGSATYPSSHYLRFQIWDRDGRLIYRTHDAPETPFTALDNNGYSWTGGADSLRTYVAWNATRQLQIQVGEPLEHRREIATRALWRLGLLAAFFLPLSALFVWWIIARSFAPVQWTSEAVAARTAHHLSDVDLADVPKELSPLIVAVNRLLERIREALKHERRFTADAAHELRTPLAAIRAHAQVLQGARNDREAAEAAQDIVAGVDRGRRLVDQLLALAGLDKAQLQALPMRAVDLAESIQAQVAEHQPMAAQQQIQLRAETQPCVVHGHVDELNMLLRNLIDNALRYTPAGGAVRVSCRPVPQGIELAVRDSGVGISAEERNRVFDRFYRIAGSQSYGSGLGLSIVQRVAEQHRADISVGEGLNGRGSSFIVLFKTLFNGQT